MNRAQHAGALDCKEMKENITRQSEAANVHGDVHSPPRTLPSGFDLLGLHGKLHAQTSTLWTLCAALTEAWPIGLRLRLDLLGLHGKIKSEFGSVHTFDTSWQIKGKEAFA